MSEPVDFVPRSRVLRCTVTRVDDRVEVGVVGDVDLTTSHSLMATVAGVIAEGAAQLVLNLEGVPFVDSTGLAHLVKIRRSCDAIGCGLQLAQVGETVARYLARTGLQAYLNAASPAAGDL